MEAAVATVSVKEQIKNMFKDLGLVFPSCATNHPFNGQTLLRKKAIRGGGTGPTTMTDAWLQHCKQAQDKVYAAFAKSGLKVEVINQPADFGASAGLHDITFVVRLDERTVRKLNFVWVRLQAYAPNMNYDRSYLNCWFVLNSTEDVKRAE